MKFRKISKWEGDVTSIKSPYMRNGDTGFSRKAANYLTTKNGTVKRLGRRAVDKVWRGAAKRTLKASNKNLYAGDWTRHWVNSEKKEDSRSL